MKYARLLIENGNFTKSFVGIDPPQIGYAVTLKRSIEKIEDNVSINKIDDIIEDYKDRHFDDLNQMGAFYDVNWDKDKGEITMSIKLYILNKEQADEFSKCN